MSVIKIPSDTDMTAVAADWERSATARQNRADELAAAGRTTDAASWAARAQEARVNADAAREGRAAYEAHLNGW